MSSKGTSTDTSASASAYVEASRSIATDWRAYVLLGATRAVQVGGKPFLDQTTMLLRGVAGAAAV
jgi:hypothetical protein